MGVLRFCGIIFLFIFVQNSMGAEGMWPFNNIPHEALKSKYGFEATPQWLNHLMKASVRFNNGGSGSFVSGHGLILTNHHVAEDALSQISDATHDYFSNGFLAKTLDQEIKIPDLEINQLMNIEDVTDRVKAAMKNAVTPADAYKAKLAVIAEIEKESLDRTGFRSNVVTLYSGAQFHLYRYKKYTDVRMVFSPEHAIGYFGGDPDNFEFPRYDLDMAMFRVYENGKPAKIEHFLQWSELGVKENDLIFVSGHPGNTSRLDTVAALALLRDRFIPLKLEMLHRKERMFLEYGKRGDEQKRQALNGLMSVQNSRKAWMGSLDGLQDESVMAAKRQTEKTLKAQVAERPDLKEYTSAWSEIETAQTEYLKIMLERMLFESEAAFNSELFAIARHLVRLADENPKPNSERLPEYADAGRESLEHSLFANSPIYSELEEAKLADSLTLLTEKIKSGHELYPLVQKILDGKNPSIRAAELIQGCKLKDVAERKRLASGGKAAIDASDDPMIKLAKLIDPASRALRKQYEDHVKGVEEHAYPKIALSLFAIHGTSLYPDATFTLRLAFGEVKGYVNKAGKVIPAFTTMGGAFDHEEAYGAKEPYALPASWHQKKRRLRLDTPFNFLSTADIIGGNSGSPMVNKEGELVGLIFDGNMESLLGDYFFDETKNRATSVDARAMMEALQRIYCARAIVAELKGKRRFDTCNEVMGK